MSYQGIDDRKSISFIMLYSEHLTAYGFYSHLYNADNNSYRQNNCQD